MLSQQITNVVYVVAAILFILDLKWMSHPKTAVRGNMTGSLGMLLAVVATLLSDRFDWSYILVGLAAGAVIGAVAAARVKMTSMPEMVGIFNGFGGGASVLVAGSAIVAAVGAVGQQPDLQMKIATVVSGIIGSVTFFGSYVAFGKLAEFLAVKWKLYTWQKIVKYGFSSLVVAGSVWYGVGVGIGLLSVLLMASGVFIGGL